MRSSVFVLVSTLLIACNSIGGMFLGQSKNSSTTGHNDGNGGQPLRKDEEVQELARLLGEAAVDKSCTQTEQCKVIELYDGCAGWFDVLYSNVTTDEATFLKIRTDFGPFEPRQAVCAIARREREKPMCIEGRCAFPDHFAENYLDQKSFCSKEEHDFIGPGGDTLRETLSVTFTAKDKLARHFHHKAGESGDYMIDRDRIVQPVPNDRVAHEQKVRGHLFGDVLVWGGVEYTEEACKNADREELIWIGKKIGELTAGSRCVTHAQCDSIPFGHRLCGGPNSFIPFSKESIDLNYLEQLNASHLELSKRLENSDGMASICSIEVKPSEIFCVENRCTFSAP